MANQFTVNPFSCTATMGQSYRNAATVPLGQQTNVLQLTKVRWVGGTAAANCTITDGQTNVVASLTAVSGTDTELNFIPPKPLTDFQVTAITGGAVYFYFL